MARPKTDPIREDRIRNEAIVDAYGPEEQAMGWYYYLETKLRFPFQARCIAVKVVSPLRKGETVRTPMMSISHSDLMPIRSERSDAGLSQFEALIDIRQEFCLPSLS
jgi:hypothetical protein